MFYMRKVIKVEKLWNKLISGQKEGGCGKRPVDS